MSHQKWEQRLLFRLNSPKGSPNLFSASLPVPFICLLFSGNWTAYVCLSVPIAVCPLQRALLCVYWVAQKRCHGKGMRDSLQKSLTKFHKEKSHFIDPTWLGIAKITTNRHQAISTCCCQHLWWIFILWDCFQPVGCFQEVIATAHTFIILGKGIEKYRIQEESYTWAWVVKADGRGNPRYVMEVAMSFFQSQVKLKQAEHIVGQQAKQTPLNDFNVRY